MSSPAGSPRLAGRHAVVTGASRGIGAVIAAALAADGVRVSLLGRDASNLQRVSESLSDADRALVASNPQRGLIEPREVADTVMWLCRPGSESVTDQSIVLT